MLFLGNIFRRRISERIADAAVKKAAGEASGVKISANAEAERLKVIANADAEKTKVIANADAEKIKELVADLIAYVKKNNQNIDPLILAGIFHKQMVIIHPFVDGNGRTTFDLQGDSFGRVGRRVG